MFAKGPPRRRMYAQSRYGDGGQDSDHAPSLTGSAASSTQSLSNLADEKRGETGKMSLRISVRRALLSMASPERRISLESCLPWGHKPHPIIGASCLLYATVPVPLWQRGHPVAACSFLAVTVTSFMSDHVNTGLTSIWHPIDKITAPLCLSLAFRAVYRFAPIWASTSLVPLLCHIFANSAVKRGNYGQFVFWHSLWHILGVALMLLTCGCADGTGACLSEGVRWLGFEGLTSL